MANPVPSDKLVDLQKNAQTTDTFVNSDDLTVTARPTPDDPSGKVIRTLAGIDADVALALERIGVQYSDPITDWTALTEITAFEAHRYPATTGDIYIPTAPLPFTTGATFDSDNWTLLQGLTLPAIISDTTIPYICTEAEYKALTFELPVGKKVYITDRDADFTVISGTGAGNTFNIIASDVVSQSISIVKCENMTAEMFGTVGDGVTDDTAAINAIFNYQIANKVIIKFSEKRYIWNDTAKTYDTLTILGSKMPIANISTDKLEYGTVFVGTMDLRVNSFCGYNFGVDHGLDAFPVAQNDALKIQSQTASAGDVVILENVVGFNSVPTAPYHAVLVEGFNSVSLKTIKGYYSAFGLALKAIGANCDDLEFFYNGTDNVIIKSDVQFGNCKDINVSNIRCVGTSGVTSQNLRVSSFDAQIERVNISNFIFDTANGFNFFVDSAVAANEINLSNGTMKNAASNNALLNGDVFNCSISDVSMIDSTGRALRTIGGVRNLTLDNVFASLHSTSPFQDSAILIESATAATSMSNVTACVNRDTTDLAGIQFDNTATRNKLSCIRANIFANNPYQDGLVEESILGSAQTLTPIFANNGMTCFIKVTTAAAAADVSTIIREIGATGRRFPAGYRVTILNDDSSTLTINHNPAGNIVNTGGSDVVLAASDAVSYVFSTATWHQV